MYLPHLGSSKSSLKMRRKGRLWRNLAQNWKPEMKIQANVESQNYIQNAKYTYLVSHPTKENLKRLKFCFFVFLFVTNDSAYFLQQQVSQNNMYIQISSGTVLIWTQPRAQQHTLRIKHKTNQITTLDTAWPRHYY